MKEKKKSEGMTSPEVSVSKNPPSNSLASTELRCKFSKKISFDQIKQPYLDVVIYLTEKR